MTTPALIALWAAAFATCALFSLAESALFSLGSVRLRRMKMRRRLTAPLVRSLVARPRRLLITIIIGNIFALTAVSSLAVTLGDRWFGAVGVAVVGAASTIVVFIFAEALPKTVGVVAAEAGAAATSPFIALCYVLFYPVNRAALAVARFVVGEPPRPTLELAPDDIYGLLQESERSGVLDETERAMIERLVTFSERTAGEIGTPRTKIFALPADTPFAEATRAVARAGFSRVPVWRGDLENVVGVVHARDLLLAKPAPPATLARLSRPAHFVPASRRALDLFVDFMRYRTHIALVVDEYGALDGLVTLSDVLSEIVGEPARLYRRVDGRRYVIAADMPLDDFSDLAGVDLTDEDAETVGGYLINRLGRIPVIGDDYREGVLRFVVIGARRQKITELTVEKFSEAEGR